MKICKICGVEKELSEFTRRNKTTYRNDCRDCKNEYLKLYYKGNNSKEFTIKNTKSKCSEKICNNCGFLKNLRLFPKRNGSVDGYRGRCFECQREYNREYHKLNKSRDRDLIKNRRDKYLSKTENKILLNIRGMLKRYLKSKGLKKNTKIEKIIGLSKDKFKVYIESQFLDDMNWTNYGINWHIDHIVPISFGKNESEIMMLNNYKNLRPLWSFDNQSKNKKLTIKNDIYFKILENRQM